MRRKKNSFLMVHFLHLCFILVNVFTGFLMLKGSKLINIHILSGLSIVLLPLVIMLLTGKARAILRIAMLKGADLRKSSPVRILTKLTATLLLIFTILSVSTGVMLRLGIHGVFNIHLFSYRTIFAIIPIHMLSAILRKR